MKTGHVIRLIAITAVALLLINPSAQAEEFCSNGSPNWTPVMNGEYHVSNNVWGSGAGVGEQCLDVDLESTYFSVIKSTHNSSGVASYPFIRKGCHWGGCTASEYNPFPIQAGEVETAPFTWVVNTDGVGGTWNAAFESFFSLTGASSPNGGGELMIWIKYNGGAGPAGAKVATVEIGGHTWDVYFMVMSSWNYIAYKITSQVDSVSLDLKDFIHDALTRGYLYTAWYLDNMEAGFEIWRDGQGLTSLYYSAEAEGGAIPVNYSPVSFLLASPSNKKLVTSPVIPFKWYESIDPNLDAIEYIFYLSGPGVDMTIANIADDSLLFDGSQTLQPNSTYTWYVEATDGFDTAASTTQRTFRTPASVGVDLADRIPNRFFLSQNYPNPFNSRTEIVFEIDSGAPVDLSVYSVRGEKVLTLRNGFHAPGRYRAAWDASKLPSGVYYYQLKTPHQCISRKCLYIK
jgi:hypothetical protein